MHLAIALLGLGSVAFAMLQWNRDEASVELISAPTPPEVTEQAGHQPTDG